MPWTEQHFPPAMSHMDAWTRTKAIEIANALLEHGHDEGFAIRVAIARAHEWAQRHPAPPSSTGWTELR
jgi:uncharacterized protein YdaT